jgi:hypothetical protein
MGTLDQLAAAGFSQAEMADYASQRHAALAAGGFSQQEIASYLGGTMGPPRSAAPEPDAAEANASFAQNIGNHIVDSHNLVNVGTGKDALATMENIGTVYGPVEAAMNFVTGAVVGVPAFAVDEAAKVASILGAPKHITDQASSWANGIASALTYQPKTAAGQQLAGAVNFPFTTLSGMGEAAAPQVTQAAAAAGAGPKSSALLGEAAKIAIDFLPAILGGELVRKMGGQRITSADMQNAAKVAAGPEATPETVASVENSMRSTYAKTGIGPYTVLEQSRINPAIAEDLKNPDVDVPQAFQPYMRSSQVGVPVSDAMKNVRPLEPETPVPPPAEVPPEVPEEAGGPRAEEAPPGETTPVAGAEPEEAGFGAARNPINTESSAPERLNTQLADALSAALKKRDMDRAYALYEQQIDDERNVIGNRADAERMAADVESGRAEAQNDETYRAEGGGSFAGLNPPDDNPALGRLARERMDPQDRYGTILMHSGLSPIEAIQNLKALGQRLMQTDLGQKVSSVMGDALRDFQMKTTPMAAGSKRAMAIAKDAANSMRKAAWQWGAFDDLLRRGYTKEQRERMWNAAEEENTLRTQGITDPTRGLGSLTDDERQTVQTLADYGNRLLERAKAVGMFQGEGVPFWTPRMVAMIGEDGEISLPQRERVSTPEGRGGNVTTSASSLKGRKHATVEETEAAAKAKFGEGATVVRDIRTMPLAMARIERAIAGRELVNRIKDIGLQIGQETVSAGEKPEMFTIDHPAFKSYRFADGAMERVPLYMSKEFEGPLKAIMTERPGALYKAFMGLKGRVMSMIMYSPLIHNMVEWGRALPMMPGKVLTGRVYFEGNAAKHDPMTMRRAIDAGLVPIGHRFFNQDLTGLLEEPTIQPGRSLTAKALGGAVGLVNKGAGEAVKAGIDYAGDVWHNTLLWDRIADLQMGLFTNLERDMIGKGLDPQTASRMAAHFANRYAGSLPNEAMSTGARKLANVMLFSRTFTLGNLGAMKDMMLGLPQDVQSQLLRDVGEAGRAGAVKVARQKAIHAFVTDVALMYVGNAVMQNAMDMLVRDKSLSQVLHGYAARFKDYLTRADKDPQAIFNIGSLFPQSQNEPGKENRIFFNTSPDGTATYVRLPTGKIGEEFQGYLTSPLDMLKRKQGTLARPLLQTLQNDKGFGRKVYDDQEPGLSGMLHAVGNVVWNILQEQVPTDSIQAGYHLMSGHGDETDALKTVGPLFGLTFSKGAPGGPEVGVMFNAEQRHQDAVAREMPGIKQDIKDGNIQDAITKMEAAQMTPEEQRMTLKYAMNPQARLNRSRFKKFQQIAPPDMLERMEQMQQEQQQEQRELQSDQQQ